MLSKRARLHFWRKDTLVIIMNKILSLDTIMSMAPTHLLACWKGTADHDLLIDFGSTSPSLVAWVETVEIFGCDPKEAPVAPETPAPALCMCLIKRTASSLARFEGFSLPLPSLTEMDKTHIRNMFPRGLYPMLEPWLRKTSTEFSETPFLTAKEELLTTKGILDNFIAPAIIKVLLHWQFYCASAHSETQLPPLRRGERVYPGDREGSRGRCPPVRSSSRAPA